MPESAPPPLSPEQQFKQAMHRIGLDRAKQLVKEFEKMRNEELPRSKRSRKASPGEGPLSNTLLMLRHLFQFQFPMPPKQKDDAK